MKTTLLLLSVIWIFTGCQTPDIVIPPVPPIVISTNAAQPTPTPPVSPPTDQGMTTTNSPAGGLVVSSDGIDVTKCVLHGSHGLNNNITASISSVTWNAQGNCQIAYNYPATWQQGQCWLFEFVSQDNATNYAYVEMLPPVSKSPYTFAHSSIMNGTAYGFQIGSGSSVGLCIGSAAGDRSGVVFTVIP